MRRWLLLVPVLVVALAPPAVAQRSGPVLHEPVVPDAREDVAMGLALDGDLPAALQTPRGLVSAPDPSQPVGAGESPYSPKARGDDQSFRPDRDTSRPDVLPYDDPFSPSTAPFKRLNAFDAVDADYTLKVRDAGVAPLAVSPVPAQDPSEELFYGNMVVELAPGRKVRIPSVGAGARVLRATAGDVPIRLYRDGAENWFVEGDVAAKVRLVTVIAAPRATFGGDFGNPSWAQLPAVPPLPPAVERSATEVAARLGVSRAMPPRDVVAKLVSYFRSFVESEEAPTSSRDIYLDLALSRKGVCRHRAFAFLVTAQHLRLPSRMITNEAHAWVEVHDGRLWRRLDLGGAGRMLRDPGSRNVPYEAPPDPFAWPQGSTRGEDLGDRTRRATTAPFSSPNGPNGTAGPNGARGPGAADAGAGPNGNGPRTNLPDTLDPNGAGGAGNGGPGDPRGSSGGGTGAFGRGALAGRGGSGPSVPDDRPPSTVTLGLAGSEARRGAPLRIRGEVRSDGDPCGFVTVDVVLRSAAGELVIGQLATDARGAYDGSIVLPSTVPLGDYDLVARTFGDAKCGRSLSRGGGGR